MNINKLALLSLLLVSCSRPPWEQGMVVPVYIDPDAFFTDEQHAIMRESMDDWSKSLDGFITFKVVGSDDYSNLVTVTSDTLTGIKIDFDGATGSTERMKNLRGGDIHMPWNVSDETFQITFIHELGHAIGLGHDSPGTVMAKHYKHASAVITCSDVTQFCSINGCDASELDPCK